jgi:hypothetical protein
MNKLLRRAFVQELAMQLSDKTSGTMKSTLQVIVSTLRIGTLNYELAIMRTTHNM